jgi:hypothetical protein
MGPIVYTVAGELWRYDGAAGWTFVTLPADVADEFRFMRGGRGFGSVRVKATLGSTTWSTSVFPDAQSRSYVLPIKAAVRSREGVCEGDLVVVTLEIDP